MAVVDSAEAGLRAATRATIIQLRAPGATAREVEREAAQLVASSPVPVLVSSRCDIALAVGAAGVNLPEGDVSPADARRLIGGGLVGRSVHSIEAARRAAQEGADFLIFGPVFSSPTHPRGAPAGLAALAEVVHAVSIPVVAIGGMTEARISEVSAAGAAGYAAIRLFA